MNWLVFQIILQKIQAHNFLKCFCLVIDASGKYVLPGGIDVDVHLETPFNEVCVSLTYIFDSFL